VGHSSCETNNNNDNYEDCNNNNHNNNNHNNNKKNRGPSFKNARMQTSSAAGGKPAAPLPQASKSGVTTAAASPVPQEAVKSAVTAAAAPVPQVAVKSAVTAAAAPVPGKVAYGGGGMASEKRAATVARVEVHPKSVKYAENPPTVVVDGWENSGKGTYTCVCVVHRARWYMSSCPRNDDDDDSVCLTTRRGVPTATVFFFLFSFFVSLFGFRRFPHHGIIVPSRSIRTITIIAIESTIEPRCRVLCNTYSPTVPVV